MRVCGLGALVEEAEDGRLEHVRDKLVLFGRESHLKLNLAVCIEPGERSIRIFLLKEEIEALCARLHLRWKLAVGLVHLGPRSVGQNLAGELDAGDGVAAAEMLVELRLHLATVVDIFEHLGHLVNLVGTAFDFELLNKILLVLPGYRRLI